MTESTVDTSTESSSDLTEALVRVLNVDDDSAFLKITKQILEVLDAFQVDTALSADEAMDKLKNTPYDAIVSDYMMPGEDGLQFLKKLRASGNTVPFIIFTGKGRETIIIEALNRGADGYFNKKGDPEIVYGELVHGIRQVVEKKRAEIKLRESQAQYLDLYNNAPNAYFSIGVNGHILRCNKRAGELLGYLPEKLVGRPMMDLYADTPKGKKAAAEVFKRLQAGNTITDQELQMQKVDGTPVWISLTVHPIHDDQGNVVENRSMAFDISERKKTERALMDSEGKYKDIFELAPDGIVTTNMRGMITSVNSAFLRLTGFSEDEIVGKHFTKIGTIRVRDLPRYIKLFSSILREKTPSPTEFAYLRKDGTQRWGEAHSSIIKENGRNVGFQAILRDITERKEASERIKASEERYRRLVELAPDGIVTMDVNGVITSRNTAASRISGYSEGELMGKHFLEFGDLPLGDLPKMKELFTSAMKGKETAPFEVNLLHKDGTPYVAEVNIGVLKENGKTVGLQVILRDITKRKKAERSLTASLEKVRSLNEKLSVVGGLTRHDVNNKLATVRANVYLAKKGLTGDHHAVQHLREIESAVGQAELIFDFARVYERLGVEALEYVNVEDAVEGACKQFSDLNVTVVNDCDGLRVLADSLLSRLFYNLIDNSLKHGKTVTTIRVYYEEAKDTLQLVYEDDGGGIPLAEKEKIFEKGYGKGTGLGLYLILKMCDVYGWTIKETGKQGEGARFTMTLPQANVDEGKTGYQLPK